MSENGIGIGIDREQVLRLMKELCIKPDRADALKEILDQCGESSTVDDLQRAIAFSTKANEVAFLSFMIGIITGSHATISQMGNIPQLLQKAAIMGAEHADEIKEMIGQQNPDQTAPAAHAAKKKDKEDIMYG
jgi:hypothetical protein